MRALNRILALLLALALIAGGLLLALETGAVLLGKQPVLLQWHPTYRDGTRDAWDTAGVRVICAVTGFVGLLLLFAQLKRRRPGRLALANETDNTDAGVTPRGVRELARSAALSVDGVSRAKVGVGRRKVSVSATSSLGDEGAARELRGPVTDQVSAALQELHLRKTLRVKTSVSSRRGDS